jgi:hypothetical protein
MCPIGKGHLLAIAIALAALTFFITCHPCCCCHCPLCCHCPCCRPPPLLLSLLPSLLPSPPLAQHPCHHRRCPCRPCHCPLCSVLPLLLLPMPSLLPSPSVLPATLATVAIALFVAVAAPRSTPLSPSSLPLPPLPSPSLLPATLIAIVHPCRPCHCPCRCPPSS